MTESRNSDRDSDRRGSGRGRQGFASMDPEEQREIASMGGRASHGGRGRDYYDDDESSSRRSSSGRSSSRDDDDERGGSGRGRQGFASMDPEERREIASMGGRASHGGRGRDYDDDDDR